MECTEACADIAISSISGAHRMELTLYRKPENSREVIGPGFPTWKTSLVVLL